jgi:hypothetical protein
MDLAKDPVIEACKRRVDRSLIRANLALSVEERMLALVRWQETAAELRGCGKPGAIGLGPVFRALDAERVEYFLDGEIAAVVHGATEFWMKLDLTYLRTSDNSARLAAALAGFHPMARGGSDLPFKPRAFRHSFLRTDLAAIDLAGLTEVEYWALREDTFELNAFGVRLRVLKGTDARQAQL